MKNKIFLLVPYLQNPKGSIVIECGNALLKHGYTIKIFNTINFQKSMHYNRATRSHTTAIL